MHIALNGWFWDQPYTGSGQYLRALLPAMRSTDPALRFTLIVPDHALLDSVPAGVEIVCVAMRLRGKPGKVWFEQQGYPAAVKKSGADIAHVPYWGPPLSSPARLVVTVHDVIPLSMPVYQGGIGARLYTSLVTAATRGAAHLITDSEFSRDEIAAWIEGIQPDRITAIPLAVSPDMHPRIGRENDEAVRLKYGLPDTYALYLGGFDIRKNVKALIAAFTYVKSALADEYPLVLAGRPPATWGTGRFPDIPAEIRRLELDDVVRLIGPVAESDKTALYRMARVTIAPSRYEGFGLVPLESMACGTPVIAADATSTPEVVGDAGYLVDPFDLRQMGGAIISLLVQDDLHENLKNQGLARATQFNWHKTAAATVDVYRRVTALREPRRRMS